MPGIGAYTGAAIGSIACCESAAVVDANVVRVLARLLKIGYIPLSSSCRPSYQVLVYVLWSTPGGAHAGVV